MTWSGNHQMEGDYGFIYDLEVLDHSPGPILFLYREYWGVTWQIGGDLQPSGKEFVYHSLYFLSLSFEGMLFPVGEVSGIPESYDK